MALIMNGKRWAVGLWGWYRPPLSIHNQSYSQRQWIIFHSICVPRARARDSKFHAETNFSRFPATEEQQRQMNSFQPPGPSQPPTNIVSARPSPPWAPEQPAPPQNAQISRSRVADHQARPVPELPWGEPGLDCGRFLRLDMPQNRHEEPFPAHMAMK